MARGFGPVFGVGSTDRVEAASIANASLFSFAGWFYCDDNTGATRRIVEVPSRTFIITNPGLGTILQFTRTFSTLQGNWTIALPLDVWTHIAITHDGTTGPPVIYLNGKAVTVTVNQTPSGTVNIGSGALYCGNNAGLANGWLGMLGDMAFWNGALLSAADARALYQGADPRSIESQYLAELVAMGGNRPFSLKRAAQPVTTGTRPRADRLTVMPENQFPFGRLSATVQRFFAQIIG